MKPTKLYLLALCGFISLSFSACEKSLDKNTTRINYGYSFGMANAVEKIQLNADLFLYDYNSKIMNIDKRCSQAAREDVFTEILNSVDYKKFKEMPESIGCPDCADGGAEFLEIAIDGEIKRVTYDYGKVPEELTAIVAKLKPVMASFKDCKP